MCVYIHLYIYIYISCGNQHPLRSPLTSDFFFAYHLGPLRPSVSKRRSRKDQSSSMHLRMLCPGFFPMEKRSFMGRFTMFT